MSKVDDVRPWHYLRRLGGTSVPRRLIFADSETVPIQLHDDQGSRIHRFRLACATFLRWEGDKATRKCPTTFTRKLDFWLWVMSKMDVRHTTWLVMHNAGFDLTTLGFWEMLEDGMFDLGRNGPGRTDDDRPADRRVDRGRGYAVLSDPPTIVDCRAGKARLMIVDSLNYFQVPLAQLADMVGMAKGTLPDWTAPFEDWVAYCANDVKILQTAFCELIRWWEMGEYGPWGPTAATLAMNAYRTKFMAKKSILVHGDKEALSLERLGYYGGETQAYYCGIVGEPAAYWNESGCLTADHRPTLPGPVHVLDVSSLYPAVMHNLHMPATFLEVLHGGTPDAVAERMHHSCCIARVIVNSPVDPYPVKLSFGLNEPYLREGQSVLSVNPYGSHQTGYRTGRFATVLCGAELAVALGRGHVESVLESAWYVPRKLFTEHVEHFWDLKEKGERCQVPAWRMLAKAMLNALAGKWGQRRGLWVDAPEEPATCPWGTWPTVNAQTGDHVVYRSIAWHTQRQTERGETEHSCPAIASYITSGARVAMMGLRNLAGWKNVYYQDTDSLHVNEEGLRRLLENGQLQDSQLGMLRPVSSHATAWYCGPKHYCLDGQWILAGVRADAVEISPRHWHQDQWERLPGIVSHPPSGGVRVTQQCTLRSLSHVHGDVGPDGWVTPWSLGRRLPTVSGEDAKPNDMTANQAKEEGQNRSLGSPPPKDG